MSLHVLIYYIPSTLHLVLTKSAGAPSTCLLHLLLIKSESALSPLPAPSSPQHSSWREEEKLLHVLSARDKNNLTLAALGLN